MSPRQGTKSPKGDTAQAKHNMNTPAALQPFAVIAIRARDIGPQKKGLEFPPSYDLQPMTHDEACAFMRSCRNRDTDYKLHPWPAEVPFPAQRSSWSRPFSK